MKTLSLFSHILKVLSLKNHDSKQFFTLKNKNNKSNKKTTKHVNALPMNQDL